MIQDIEHPQLSGLRETSDGLRWLGEPVTVWCGCVEFIETKIPTFARRPFSMELRRYASSEPEQFAQRSLFEQDGFQPFENRFLDVIVRLHDEERPFDDVPVGIVSKRYSLVQHRDLFYAVIRAMKAAQMSVDSIWAELLLTEYGGKMALRFVLPPKHTFDPGDGHPLALRLECFNSVDRSIPLRLMLGWFRSVCANGIAFGESRLQVDQIHNEYLDLGDVDRALFDGLSRVTSEQERCKSWLKDAVNDGQLIRFVDGALKEKWGVLAASRTYHIARTGCDGVPTDRFEKSAPHEKKMRSTKSIPGSAKPAKDAFAVSQILAWLARERHDVQEQLEWSAAIPGLIEKLIEPTKAAS